MSHRKIKRMISRMILTCNNPTLVGLFTRQYHMMEMEIFKYINHFFSSRGPALGRRLQTFN